MLQKKILSFNIFYYCVTLILFIAGRNDPSSSLGYMIFVGIFWLMTGVMLIYLLIAKIIQPYSLSDWIGIFAATPILCVLFFWVISIFHDPIGSEYHFNKNGSRFKAKMIYYKNGFALKRIEYYQNLNGDWLRDSTWIYFSESGDTVRRVSYINGRQVE